jgi:Peptidase family M28
MVRIVQRLLNLRSHSTVAFLSFLIVWLVFSSAAQSPATTGVDSIRAEELRQKVSYIASEKFKGRGNGTPELNMAADYIAGIFEKNGLKPAGDTGTYYQRFNVYSSRLGSNNELRVRSSSASLDLKARSDFIPELWSVSGTVTGPLELVEDNRPGAVRLDGKIAVEVEDRIVSDDPEFPANATEGRKLEAAGAIGAIIVQNLPDNNRSRLANLAENFRDDLPVRLTAMASVDVPDYPQIPVVVLPSEVGRQLLTELRKPQANVTAVLTVDVERKLHGTQNVLGLIEGSDTRLRNEVVVVGAHYDHDGEAFGQIWYGADDNGSGTAALLELAEAFGQGSRRPARSVLLSAWAGEEKGLLGSRFYVSHPVFPLNHTIAMFQMDMIGRNEEHPGNRSQDVPEERALDNANTLNVLGTAFSPDLKTIIGRVNDQIGLTLHFRYDFGAEDLMRRSDQWSFLQNGIPAIFFFAGLHPDYHTPRDTAEKINYPKLEKAARLVYLATSQLANLETKPRFVKATAALQKPY